MGKLLYAEGRRMLRSMLLWLWLALMLAAAGFFVWMQATAMAYTVPLSRVIFLPLTLWGLACAAFVSLFFGEDFSGGFVRVKLMGARRRVDYVLAQLSAAALACGAVYLLVTGFTCALSLPFFERDVQLADFLQLLAVGLAMSMAQGCLFAALTLLCANQARGVFACMALAFGMLVLALHTNSALVQPAVIDAAPNPHAVQGIVRQAYLLLHNLNPTGQAAQLSAWEMPRPGVSALCSLLLSAASAALCSRGFEKKDIF